MDRTLYLPATRRVANSSHPQEPVGSVWTDVRRWLAAEPERAVTSAIQELQQE